MLTPVHAASPPSNPPHAQSAAAKGAPGTPAPGGAIRLYKYDSEAGEWRLRPGAARPRFYDVNEDTGKSTPDYFLEIEAGDVDVRVDQVRRRRPGCGRGGVAPGCWGDRAGGSQGRGRGVGHAWWG